MKKIPLVYHRIYDIPLPEKHRFPGSKYSALLMILESEGLIKSFLKYSPKPATAAQLSIVHDQNYLQAVESGNLSKQHETRIGLSWSKMLKRRSFLAANGTCCCAARSADWYSLSCGRRHTSRTFGLWGRLLCF